VEIDFLELFGGEKENPRAEWRGKTVETIGILLRKSFTHG